MIRSWFALSTLLVLAHGMQSGTATAQTTLTAAEALAIAQGAYIYGYPMVDGDRIQHAYFVDRNNLYWPKPEALDGTWKPPSMAAK